VRDLPSSTRVHLMLSAPGELLGFGTKRKYRGHPAMFAFGGKADMADL
jgi:hypothetical protein